MDIQDMVITAMAFSVLIGYFGYWGCRPLFHNPSTRSKARFLLLAMTAAGLAVMIDITALNHGWVASGPALRRAVHLLLAFAGLFVVAALSLVALQFVAAVREHLRRIRDQQR